MLLKSQPAVLNLGMDVCTFSYILHKIQILCRKINSGEVIFNLECSVALVTKFSSSCVEEGEERG